MGASGAKYGIMTSHFYWLGAIPAMVFVGIFMMPFYYGSKARSVPEYLKLRFDEKTRGFNALSFAFMTVFSSGHFDACLGPADERAAGLGLQLQPAGFRDDRVGVYLPRRSDLGDLQRSAAILSDRAWIPAAGPSWDCTTWAAGTDWWPSLTPWPSTQTALRRAPGRESWQHMGNASDNPMGVEWFGMVMGLGFVLSFGYWCTDFLVVQRAMAANSMSAARRTPLIAAFPKMLLPAPGDLARHDRHGLGEPAGQRFSVAASRRHHQLQR